MSVFSEKERDGVILDKLRSLPTLGPYQYDQTQAFLISEVNGIPFVRFSSSSHALIIVSLAEELARIGVEYDPEKHYVGIGFSTGNRAEIQFRVRHVMPSSDLTNIQKILSSHSLGMSCNFISD